MRCQALLAAGLGGLIALGGSVSAARSQEAPQVWDARAVSATRVEHYENQSDLDVYPFTGTHSYTDLQLQFQRAPSPFNRLYGTALGLYSDSDYRGNDDGFVLENFNLGWELGDTRLPFRAQLGDFLGFYSLRTLQRPLKGAQFELQPTTATSQSLVLTAGTANTTYRNFEANDDRYLGLSYTVAPGERTSLGLNLLHNHRDGDLFAEGTQKLASLTLDRSWRWGANELLVEGEAAYLDGDVLMQDGTTGNGEDAGYFAQLGGRGRHYDYRLRFEDLGEDFRPNGAVVVGDRQSVEAHLGWRPAGALALRGRWQRYQDARRSADPLDTETVGLQLTTPWLGSTALDAYRTRRDNDSGTLDTTTSTVRVNLASFIGQRWTARFGAFTQAFDDDVQDTTRDVHQLDLGLDRRIGSGRLSGSLGIGMVGRARRGDGGEVNEVSPTLRATITRAPHDLRLVYAYLDQRARDDAAGDSDRHSAALAYSLFNRRHRLTLEADYQRQDDAGLARAEGNRVALTYTLSLDRAAARRTSSPARPLPAFMPVAAGTSFATANARLAEAGSAGRSQQQGLWVYQLRLLESVAQRQQVMVREAAGLADRLAIVIDFDDPTDPAGTAETYARVREALVRQLGSPTLVVEQGEFTNDLGAATERREFVRLLEWNTVGGRLRFGIPARMDALVRMEVQLAASLPPVRDARWSLADGVP